MSTIIFHLLLNVSTNLVIHFKKTTYLVNIAVFYFLDNIALL